jgi:hypothetical protein
VSLIGKLDAWAARFNRWFGPTEVAAGAEHMGASGGPPQVDPAAVAGVIGAIERDGDEREEEPKRD